MLCPIRPIPTTRGPVQGEIRRACWRDAAQVALLLARAHRRASGRHPDALSWYVRPPLIRALILWIVGALMTVVAETWITDAPSACLAIRRTAHPWRFPVDRLALVVVGAVVGAGLYAVLVAPVDLALRNLLPPLAVELVLDAPVLVLIGFGLAYIAIETLRRQTAFDDYLARRAADPSYSFRRHLRRIGGAIEE